MTEQLARFAVESPSDFMTAPLIESAKAKILDTLATSLAGSRAPATTISLQTVRQSGGRPEATVIGWGEKTSLVNAGFVNGVAAHALEYRRHHLRRRARQRLHPAGRSGGRRTGESLGQTTDRRLRDRLRGVRPHGAWTSSLDHRPRLASPGDHRRARRCSGGLPHAGAGPDDGAHVDGNHGFIRVRCAEECRLDGQGVSRRQYRASGTLCAHARPQ